MSIFPNQIPSFTMCPMIPSRLFLIQDPLSFFFRKSLCCCEGIKSIRLGLSRRYFVLAQCAVGWSQYWLRWGRRKRPPPERCVRPLTRPPWAACEIFTIIYLAPHAASAVLELRFKPIYTTRWLNSVLMKLTSCLDLFDFSVRCSEY